MEFTILTFGSSFQNYTEFDGNHIVCHVEKKEVRRQKENAEDFQERGVVKENTTQMSLHNISWSITKT